METKDKIVYLTMGAASLAIMAILGYKMLR